MTTSPVRFFVISAGRFGPIHAQNPVQWVREADMSALNNAVADPEGSRDPAEGLVSLPWLGATMMQC